MTTTNRARVARLLIVATLLSGLPFIIPAAATGGMYMQAPSWLREVGDGDRIGQGYGGGGSGVSDQPASLLSDLDLFRSNLISTQTVRIALISSGVDTSSDSLPASLTDSNNLTIKGTLGDPVGYGTMAASALFQLFHGQSNVSITSYGVYPDGKLDAGSGWLQWALSDVYTKKANFDVVLLAFPPTELLDPTSAGMNSGQWEKVIDIVSRRSADPNGNVFGIPMDDEWFLKQKFTSDEYPVIESFRTVLKNWDMARRWINGFQVSTTVSVVMPAGDVGPGPQSIMGLANLDSVISVGGYNTSQTVSPKSASGPSIDLKVKPDLLAPTGITTVLPLNSKVAKAYSDAGILVTNTASQLPVDWVTDCSCSSFVPKAAAIADTTMVSAAVVAAAIGGLKAQGMTDPSLRRGALLRAAEMIEGEPVWRQGSGVLGGTGLSVPIPTYATATSTPMALDHIDLGFQPNSGVWSASTKVTGGTPVTTTVQLQNFIGAGFGGGAVSGSATGNEPPTMTATSLATQTVVEAEVKDDPSKTGLYCGRVTIDIETPPVGGGTTTTSQDEAPLCLADGFRPVARSFELHNDSMNDNSFLFIPKLPPGGKVLGDVGLKRLPIDPAQHAIASAITASLACTRWTPTSTYSDTCTGLGKLPVMFAGYYQVRAFSDYGAPMQFDVSTTSTSTPTTTVNLDHGFQMGYSSFDTLVLPRAPHPECDTAFATYGSWEDWSGHKNNEQGTWRNCTEKFLTQLELTGLEYKFNQSLAGFDTTTTATYVEGFAYDVSNTVTGTVQPIAVVAKLHVNLGFIRKVVDTSVISRYIDLVDPCKDMQTRSFMSDQQTTIGNLITATAGGGPWSTSCSSSAGLRASVVSTSTSSQSDVAVATAEYPFAIPTPNFGMHISLNFGYKITNSFILVSVVVGNRSTSATITPEGVFNLPPGGLLTGIDLDEVPAEGHAEGLANFEWAINSLGASEGKISFVFGPQVLVSDGTLSQNLVVSSAEIKSTPAMSFELDSNGIVPWPKLNFDKRGAATMTAVQSDCVEENRCGHTFGFDSNFSPYVTGTAGQRIAGQISGRCALIDNGSRRGDVCEDWSVTVHSPKITAGSENDDHVGASLMDVLDFSTSTKQAQRSILTPHPPTSSAWVDGGMFVPPTRTMNAPIIYSFKGSPVSVTANSYRSSMRTNGSHFELLKFPMSILSLYSGPLLVCINDGVQRSTSICEGRYRDSANNEVPTATATTPGVTWTAVTNTVGTFPKTSGRVTVKPYIPYIRDAVSFYWPTG